MKIQWETAQKIRLAQVLTFPFPLKRKNGERPGCRSLRASNEALLRARVRETSSLSFISP
jgi:hypothetical protein